MQQKAPKNNRDVFWNEHEDQQVTTNIIDLLSPSLLTLVGILFGFLYFFVIFNGLAKLINPFIIFISSFFPALNLAFVFTIFIIFSKPN